MIVYVYVPKVSVNYQSNFACKYVVKYRVIARGKYKTTVCPYSEKYNETKQRYANSLCFLHLKEAERAADEMAGKAILKMELLAARLKGKTVLEDFTTM